MPCAYGAVDAGDAGELTEVVDDGGGIGGGGTGDDVVERGDEAGDETGDETGDGSVTRVDDSEL